MTIANKIKFNLIKILNRFGLLRFVNLSTRIFFFDREFIIPVNGGVGLEHLYTFDDYDFMVYSFFKSEIVADDFLDIGANTGQTIIKINALASDTHVFSVEPNPNCLTYLALLKSLNLLDRIQIIPAALFDSPGVKKLYSISAADTSASLVSNNRPGFFEESKFLLVNAINGEQLSQLLTNRISFIKIDVEGAEFHVLKSIQAIIKKNQPVIYCEVLDAHSDEVLSSNNVLKKEIWDFVTQQLKYKIYRFDAKIKSLNEIDRFPEGVYSSDNLDRCNYIFKP